MPLLDGKNVPASEIDPAKHRFIGMFRPAENPFANAVGIVSCFCGDLLAYGQAEKHYRNGCFDELQYQSIDRQIHWCWKCKRPLVGTMECTLSPCGAITPPT